jgi:hypothetical protein
MKKGRVTDPGSEVLFLDYYSPRLSKVIVLIIIHPPLNR